MTTYEIINSIIAIIALIISTVSLIRGRKIQTKQLEFEAITAALAKKQLELLEKDETSDDRANVTAEMVKVSSGNYRFVIINQGPAVASNVAFEIDPASPDNPLVTNDVERKIPFPLLQPGQSFTLIAALDMGSAMSYDTYLSWNNPDGSKQNKKIHLST